MPRPETILDCLDDSTRKRLDEALLSNLDEPVADVYRRFGLAQRDITERGFYAYANRLRSRFSKKDEAPVAAPGRPRAMETLHRLFDVMNDRLDANDPDSMPGIATAMRAVNDCMRLTLDEEADRRAAELHAIKLKDLSKTLRADVDAKSEGGTKTLQREDVYDMIDKIMRGGE